MLMVSTPEQVMLWQKRVHAVREPADVSPPTKCICSPQHIKGLGECPVLGEDGVGGKKGGQGAARL